MWSDFESNIVEGRYPLSRLVRSEGRCGWFETQFDVKRAIISLIESLNDEAMLMDRLRTAEKVKNENVAEIYAAGATQVRGTPLVYAVMEYTEENLEDVLRTRALLPEETKQVGEGLVGALRAIHKERLVCGRLEAASVLAAGDTIKLRSDYLQRVPGDVAFEPYAAKDVRDLGSLLHQCLTQKALKSATDGNDPSLQLLPAPFVQIVRRTLGGGNATVDEIAVLLNPALAPAVTAPQAKSIATGAVLAAAPKPKVAEQSVPLVAPVVNEKPRKPVEEMLERDEVMTPRRMPLILGGCVILLVVLGFALRAVLHHSDRSQDASAQNPKVVVSPETATPRKPPPVVPPSAPSSGPPPMKAHAAPVASSTSPAGAWRVVAFTYNYQAQAEHKARTINEKHPDLQAGVFSPKGSGAPYLVTIGSATDRASAFRLREKAIQEGLPGDTYAQNYSR